MSLNLCSNKTYTGVHILCSSEVVVKMVECLRGVGGTLECTDAPPFMNQIPLKRIEFILKPEGLVLFEVKIPNFVITGGLAKMNFLAEMLEEFLATPRIPFQYDYYESHDVLAPGSCGIVIDLENM